jgi:hypothetical protein
MSQQTVRPTDFTPPEANPAEYPPTLGPATHNDRCQFSFADGRRCGMLRWQKHRLYCLPHAREEERLLAVDKVGHELTSLSGEFNTFTDINHVLGKVFTLLAHNRIDRRDAVAYAYVAQLLLQTIPTVKDEVCEALGRPAWKERLQDTLCEPPDVTQVDAQAEEPDVTQIDAQAADERQDLAQAEEQVVAETGEPDVAQAKEPDVAQANEEDEAQTDDQPDPPQEIPESAQQFAHAAEDFATPASAEPTASVTDARSATEPAALAPTARRLRPRPQPPQTFYTDERGARIPAAPRG